MSNYHLPPRSDLEWGSTLNWPAGILLALHGLIHSLGALLYLGIAENGAFTAAAPGAGTAWSTLVGLLWATGGLLFVITAVRMVAHRPWELTAIAAAAISAPAALLMIDIVPPGLVIDVAVVVAALWSRRHPGRLLALRQRRI